MAHGPGWLQHPSLGKRKAQGHWHELDFIASPDIQQRMPLVSQARLVPVPHPLFQGGPEAGWEEMQFSGGCEGAGMDGVLADPWGRCLYRSGHDMSAGFAPAPNLRAAALTPPAPAAHPAFGLFFLLFFMIHFFFPF